MKQKLCFLLVIALCLLLLLPACGKTVPRIAEGTVTQAARSAPETTTEAAETTAETSSEATTAETTAGSVPETAAATASVMQQSAYSYEIRVTLEKKHTAPQSVREPLSRGRKAVQTQREIEKMNVSQEFRPQNCKADENK